MKVLRNNISTRLKLQSLNFFIADLQAGVGSFIGIFLLQFGWKAGSIGAIMTIGGICGMLMTAPAGGLIDKFNQKKLFVIIPGICVIMGSLILLLSHQFWVVALSQVSTALAGALIVPAIGGITLGIFKQKGYEKQNGLNQVFNHAGNMVGAGFSGLLAIKFGFYAVIGLSIFFGFGAIISAIMIPSAEIDNAAARGLLANDDKEDVGALKILWQNRPLLILALCLALFHLGNSAMLPMYGLALAENGAKHPYFFVALTVVIAQLTMVFMSFWAMKIAQNKGNWFVVLISFFSLFIRGIIASNLISPIGIYPVQVLDGVGAGLQSVAVPVLVANLLNGTGRINLGQGIVMTIQGIGASVSPLVGGILAQRIGYNKTFLILGAFSLGSIIPWLIYSNKIKTALKKGAH